MSRRKLLCALLLASSTAFANSDWGFVLDGERLQYHARVNSFEIVKDEQQQSSVRGIYRREVKAEKSVTVVRIQTRLSDCRARMGRSYMTTLDGEFIQKSDYVFGAGNVSSGVAEHLCSEAGALVRAPVESSPPKRRMM